MMVWYVSQPVTTNLKPGICTFLSTNLMTFKTFLKLLFKFFKVVLNDNVKAGFYCCSGLKWSSFIKEVMISFIIVPTADYFLTLINKLIGWFM